MKNKILVYFTFLSAVFFGCQEKADIIYKETGVVVDYAGSEHCSFVIELDNGQQIQPLPYTKDFEFSHGQRVFIEYKELPNVIATCGNGYIVDILHVEEIECGPPLIHVNSINSNGPGNDPVFMQEAYVERNCLHLKLSFGGGCRDHTINLARVISNVENQSDTAILEIRHDSNNDLCEAWLTQSLQFDISELVNEGIKKFVLRAKLYDGNYEEVFVIE